MWVTTDGAPVTSDSTYLYTLAANPDGTGVIDTSSSAATFSIPAGALAAGTTYYWNVQIDGPSNYGGATESLTSPWYSFIATADPNLQSDTSPQTAQAQTAQSPSAGPSRCGIVDVLTLRGTNSPKGTGVGPSYDPNIYANHNGYGTPVAPDDGYGKVADPEYKLVTAIRASSASYQIYTEAINYEAGDDWATSVAGGLQHLTNE